MDKIIIQNPWRKDKDFQIVEAKQRRRFLYKDIIDYLENTKFMISISGLRRLGKTTIIKQLISSYLKKHSNKQIMYYKFSDIDTNIESVLSFFLKTLNYGIDIYKDTFYIFLDEVQYVKDWQNVLLNYYELNKNIRFIISGSASLYINKNTRESLAGRIVDFRINPMLFDEFIYLKYGDKLRFDLSEAYIQAVALYNDEFSQYLMNGEYPEIIEFNRDKYTNYLNNMILKKVFSKDIEIFNIKKKQELFSIYDILLEQVGSLVNTTTIANDIGIAKATINTYKNILQLSYLLEFTKNYLKGIRKQYKSFDKVYSTSINLLLSSFDISDIEQYQFRDFKGHVVENYIHNRLLNYYDKLYFYNKNNFEVDFVGIKDSQMYPIEVKFGSKLTARQLSPILTFCRKFDLKDGIVFYGGEYKTESIKGIRIQFFPWKI